MSVPSTVVSGRRGGLRPARWRLLQWTCAALAALANPAYPASISVPAGTALSLPGSGSATLACSDLNVSGTVSVGGGSITGIGNVSIGAGGVLNGGPGLIQLGGSWSNAGTFNPGGGTVRFDGTCTAGPVTIGGNTTFANLSLDRGTYAVSGCSRIVVTGALTFGTGVTMNSSDGLCGCIALGPGARLVGAPAAGTAICAGPRDVPALGTAGLSLLALSLGLLGAAWVRRSRPASRTRIERPGNRTSKGRHHG